MVSDTHGFHDQISCPDGDVFVHAGDLTRKGKLSELQDAVRWLRSLPYSQIIVIAGNHDFCLQDPDRRAEAESIISPVRYLRNSGVTVDGKHFWGSPWTPEFGNWVFQYSRANDSAMPWSKIPESTDVLVTHGPPEGIGDRTRSGIRAGCNRLRATVEARNPQLHVFGHIHEGYGRTQVDDTTFVNASVTSVGYQSVREPIQFTLE